MKRTAGRAAALLLGFGMLGQAVADEASLAADLAFERANTPYRVIPANVIGDDDRVLAGMQASELASAVGIVTCSRQADGRTWRSRGTGTLIGSRSTVLTAAHLFVAKSDGSTQRINFDAETDCSFRQADATGGPDIEVGFSLALYGDRSARQPDQDWAVLKTSEPLPQSKTALPFASLDMAALADRDRLPVVVVAFHADMRNLWRQPLLSAGELFSVTYAGFLRTAHTADMGRMSSGAAIVRQTANGRSIVVAVHRSAANFGEFNLAVPIAGELDLALKSIALGQVPDYQQQLALLSQNLPRD